MMPDFNKFYVGFSFLLFTLFFLPVWTLPAAAEETGYAAVTGSCGISFPKDHGAHRRHRIEWWYYTGNLETADGRPFGFQLTFFRSRIKPPQDTNPVARSAWRTEQIYMAHVALSDIGQERFYSSEAMAREAVGLAGARKEKNMNVVFLKGWRATIEESHHRLAADAGDFSFELDLTPVKQPVLQGEGGYSQKGNRPEQASCYYSMTHLETIGNVVVGEKRYPVTGLAWMDHEYSSEPLDPGAAGWDWFSLQLTDDTELMLYRIRMKGGGTVSHGTLVTANGDALPISGEAMAVTSTATWESQRTGTVYPAGWRISIPDHGIALTVIPAMADQEMRSELGGRFTYWEGSVTLSGNAGKKAVAGRGYVELTGYAPDAGAPM